jgi:hypothetical protein
MSNRSQHCWKAIFFGVEPLKPDLVRQVVLNLESTM